MMDDDLKLAWIAGLIDGEGCFDITPNFSPRLRIRMCHKETLLKVKEILGVGNVTGGKKPKSPKHNPRWTWAICNPNDTFLAITQILPFLYTKQWEAMILLQFSHPLSCTTLTFSEKETLRLALQILKHPKQARVISQKRRFKSMKSNIL